MSRILVALALTLATLAGLSAQQPAGTGQLNVIPVQGKVHMISGAGVNITVHVGKYGVLVVDTPSPTLSTQVIEQIRKLSPLPIRWVINTSSDPAHVGGNAALMGLSAGRGRSGAGAPFGFVGLERPSIVAHAHVL